jgi:hypothetical protein
LIKALTNGGFGDSALSFAKLHTVFTKAELSNVHVTHIRTRNDKLNKVIHQFYNTQNISNEVITVDSWNWQKEHRDEFDMFLGTGWSEKNPGDEDSWVIEPFPDIIHNVVKDVNIVLNPRSGGVDYGKKEFSEEDIEEFMSIYPDTYIVGNGDDEHKYSKYKNSLYNKTSIQELVDILASAFTIISPEGFVPYFGAMCGARVLCKNQNIQAIKERVHPYWNFSLIEKLKNIQI